MATIRLGISTCPNDTFVFHGLRFHILSRLRNQILQINISRVANPKTPN